MPPLTRKKSTRHTGRSPEADPSKHALKDAKKTPRLLALPPELQNAILEYLPRPSDMKTLCLVWKDLHALTLPHLYRDVLLPFHLLNNRLTSAFTASHPGLPHIRSLRINKFSAWNCFSSISHLPALYKLLAVMPADSLRIFELATTMPVNERLGLLLRIKQRRLLNHLQLSCQSKTDRLIPAIDEVNHVTCLQLYLSNRQDCTTAGLLLGRMSSVTSLSITLKAPALDSSMGNAYSAGREVINTLFPPDYATHPRAKLKRLRIASMSFHSAGTILPTVIPLNELKHLHLLKCADTERLYESLAQLTLTLLSFCDERCASLDEGAMDTFLKSLAPLQKLRIISQISAVGFEKFAWSTLLPHAPELRCLEVGDYRPRNSESFMETRRTVPAFQTLCDRTSGLQYLSMLGPAIERYDWKSTCGLDAFLACLGNIRTLKFLKLNVQPECLGNHYLEDDDYYGDGDATEIIHDLRREIQWTSAQTEVKVMVDHIFETLVPACPHFVALAVEASWEEGDSCDCGVFVRTKQIGMFGNTSYVGVGIDPIERKALKYELPCSEVFEDLAEEDLLHY